MLSEFRGHHCQHRSDDFPDIAAILKPHKPRVVVELGTDRGGFGAFLANLVGKWGGVVHTFDIEPKFKPSLLTDFPNLHFYQADILGTGPLTGAPGRPCVRHQEIAALVAQPSVFLYCDNGHKQSEVELYAPLLQVGSILGVHDYNTEIMGSWVEPFVAALGYEREGHERMEALRNEWYTEPMSRFWVRRRIVEPVVAPPPEPAPELPIDLSDDLPPAEESAAESAWFIPEGQPLPEVVEVLPSGDGTVGRRRRRRLLGVG